MTPPVTPPVTLGGDADGGLAAVFRAEWGPVLATLVAGTGDWDLAEECVQEAFALALARWPTEGTPRRPGAWLTTAARNRARDRFRRAATESRKLEELAMASPPEPEPEPYQRAEGAEGAADGPIPDDQLSMIFTCAHPALPLEARVALTARSLTGLSTAELARAFLVPEPTMAQRISRAKAKIRNAGIPFRTPSPEHLGERTGGVLAVLYLLFTEGYAASSGDVHLRPELSGEAIRLARLVHGLLPDDDEVAGLYALLLLQDSRRGARTDDDGDPVPLDEQDRAAWDHDAVDAGLAVLAALPDEPAGPYRLQAEIAAEHARAPRPEDTDWPRIAALYRGLAAVTGSPVVALGRAVAVGMADGPRAGLAVVETVRDAGHLGDHHLLPATEADLWRRAGEPERAAAAYRAALARVTSGAERRFLERRLAEAVDGTVSGAP